jgi:hypothetical protein
MECEAMSGIPFASDRLETSTGLLVPTSKTNAASNQTIHQPECYAAVMYGK